MMLPSRTHKSKELKPPIARRLQVFLARTRRRQRELEAELRQRGR